MAVTELLYHSHRFLHSKYCKRGKICWAKHLWCQSYEVFQLYRIETDNVVRQLMSCFLSSQKHSLCTLGACDDYSSSLHPPQLVHAHGTKQVSASQQQQHKEHALVSFASNSVGLATNATLRYHGLLHDA